MQKNRIAVLISGIALVVIGYSYQSYQQSIADAYNEGASWLGGYGDAEPSITGWVIFFIGLWTVAGHIAGSLAVSKGKNYIPFFWFGALFPLVGIIYAALMSPQTPKSELVKCPYCVEDIHKDAIFCKHCRKDIDQKG